MIRILNSSEIARSEIFERKEAVSGLEGIVAAIIENVKTRGDAALFEYAEKFDGGLPGGLEVTEKEIEEAFASVPAELLGVMREAEENIRAFHSKQVRNGFVMTEKEGVINREGRHLRSRRNGGLSLHRSYERSSREACGLWRDSYGHAGESGQGFAGDTCGG